MMTPKMQRFVDEYLVDLNATQAAIRAGYSKKSAKAVGNENLTKPDIQQAIDKALKARALRTEITVDDVVNGISRNTAAAEEDGDHRTALKGYELLGRHLGMFTDKVKAEMSGPDGGAIPTHITIQLVRPHKRDDDRPAC